MFLYSSFERRCTTEQDCVPECTSAQKLLFIINNIFHHITASHSLACTVHITLLLPDNIRSQLFLIRFSNSCNAFAFIVRRTLFGISQKRNEAEELVLIICSLNDFRVLYVIVVYLFYVNCLSWSYSFLFCLRENVYSI